MLERLGDYRTDDSFQFLLNYRCMVNDGVSLILVNPSDMIDYTDFYDVFQSCPSHHLTIFAEDQSLLGLPGISEIEGVSYRLLSGDEFRWMSLLINETHFAMSFGNDVWNHDEWTLGLLEKLERRALKESPYSVTAQMY